MRWIERHLSDMDLYIIAGVCDKQKKKYEEEIQDMQDKLEEYGINKDIFKAIENDDLKYGILQGIFNIKQDECTYKEKYEKLQKKHRKASQMIAELKNNKPSDKESAIAISRLIFHLMKNAGYQAEELHFEYFGSTSVISAINKNNTLLLKILVELPLNLNTDIEFTIRRDKAGNSFIKETTIPHIRMPSNLDILTKHLLDDSNYTKYDYDSLKWKIKSIEENNYEKNIVTFLEGNQAIYDLCLLKQGLLFEPANDEIYFKLRKDNYPLMFKYRDVNFTVYGVLAPKTANVGGMNVDNIGQVSILDLKKVE